MELTPTTTRPKATSRVAPFTSNLEYLPEVLTYLKAVRQKRLAANPSTTASIPDRTARVPKPQD